MPCRKASRCGARIEHPYGWPSNNVDGQLAARSDGTDAERKRHREFSKDRIATRPRRVLRPTAHQNRRGSAAASGCIDLGEGLGRAVVGDTLGWACFHSFFHRNASRSTGTIFKAAAEHAAGMEYSRCTPLIVPTAGKCGTAPRGSSKSKLHVDFPSCLLSQAAPACDNAKFIPLEPF